MLVGSTVNRVAIVGAVRTPFARAMGAYAQYSNQDLLTATLKALVERYQLQGLALGEVAAGAVMKHSRDFNLTREAVLSSGLAPETPAYDLQQACGTSLETAITIGAKIALGQIEVGIAAGVDSASDVPIVYPRSYQQLLLKSARGRSAIEKLTPWFGLRPTYFKPVTPGVTEPRTGLSMGQSCEQMAKHWGIRREDQDALAVRSHHNAATAYDSGFMNSLLVPFAGLQQDNNLRRDTSVEKLAKLKPVFDRSANATLTAGNSTPLTDGAAGVLLATEAWARAHNLPVLAYLSYGKTAAVDFVNKEGLLMAPAYAVPRLLQDAKLTLQDFDYYEIHEAFAAQVLCTLKAWESAEFCREKLGLKAALGNIDRSKLNVVGSSLAVGHPFAATGARIVGVLAKLLAERGGQRGLISVCTAGGMGVTAILERG
jgi:acetyl-CoA C-acetyltransferase